MNSKEFSYLKYNVEYICYTTSYLSFLATILDLLLKKSSVFPSFFTAHLLIIPTTDVSDMAFLK